MRTCYDQEKSAFPMLFINELLWLFLLLVRSQAECLESLNFLDICSDQVLCIAQKFVMLYRTRFDQYVFRESFRGKKTNREEALNCYIT